jgi:hypothetical protein
VGFNAHRSTDGGLNFSKLNTATLLANSTSFIDPSPVDGAVYKVEAFNAKGSTYSPIARPLTVTVAATNGPTFTAPATINLEATVASLPVGVTISQVEFYNGTPTLLSTDTTAPYTFSWTPVMGGSYSITAKVTDSQGGITISPAITVAVASSITADFTATGTANGADIGFCETITFASISTGAVTGYSWSINGTNYNSSTVNNINLSTGIYPVTLGVVNSATTETAQITKNITIVNHNPIAITGASYTVVPGGTLALDGSGTDLLDSCNTTALTYAWNVDNKGNYDFFTANPTIPYNTLKAALGIGTHTMTFKVTDSGGGIGTAITSLEVLPAGTILINGGAAVTNSSTVTLAMTVYPGAGITTMRFSNDGVNYTTDETFTTSTSWTLAAGDGAKTVYVRFSDSAGNLYDAISAQITLATKDGILPGTTSLLGSALRGLQMTNGKIIPTALELVHGDVAPYYSGASHPDGKINLGDVSVILMRAVGSISGF